jgi:hypothetical protein
LAKHHHHRRRHHHNPRFSYHRGRRNPLGLSGDIFVEAAWGVAGGVLAGTIPARFFPSYNSGWAGVAGSLVTTVAASWAAGRFISPKARVGIAIGGLITTITRAVKTVMPGTSLLGAYVASDFSSPTVSDPYGRWQWPYKAQLAAAAASRAGMGVMQHRYASRFSF